MAKKKVHSVFRDLYPEDQAAEMEMRSLLLQGLGNWLADSGMTQTEAAKILAVTQARSVPSVSTCSSDSQQGPV
jgi:predicted XRE-type DNA-binding protein